MLEFAKKVLVNVSFDKALFAKELKKLIKQIGQKDSLVLYSWCLFTFGEKYRETNPCRLGGNGGRARLGGAAGA